MSWKDCAGAIRSAAGRDLTDNQVIEVFEAVDRRKRALVAEGKLDGLDARLAEAVAADADRLAVEAALARKHAALSVIARDRVSSMVDRHIAAGLTPRKAVLAIFEGTTRGVEGGRNSVAATKLAYEARYVGGMMAAIVRDVPHAEGLWRDRAFLDDVVREMMELREGGAPGRSGNADARKVARIMADSAELSRQDLNRLGANIGKLDGWAGAQIHDADLVGRSTPEAWIAAILPKLDLERTFPGMAADDTQKALRNVWENIVFSPDRAAPAEPAGVRGPPNVAKALERHRVLHFKSADDWLAYSQDFGHGHIFDGMVAHQSRAALNASQMELLGPNPGNTLESVLDGLRRRIDTDDSIAPADKDAAKKPLTVGGNFDFGIGAAFRIASGQTMIAHNALGADISGGIRAVESMAKLGGAVLSSMTDLATAMANLRFNGLSFGEAIRGQMAELFKGRGRGEQRELAFLLGEGFDGVIGHIVSPHVANDTAPGMMHSAMTTFFRWSGLTLWTDAQRAGVSRILSAHLGRQSGLPFAELPARMQTVFKQHDISPAMWETIRASTRDIDGKRYVTPEGVGDRQAELALRRYYSDEAVSSVLEADAATQRFTTGGSQRGTIPGEAMRFLMQFKSFPIAFTQRTLGRAVQGGEGGTNAGAAHIGTLLAGLTILGYAAMSAKDAVKGYEPREFLNEQGQPRVKTILAALAQSGGAGIFGDLLFGQVSRSGNTALELVAGPAIGDASKWLNLFGRARTGEASAGEAVTTALGSVPFANLFYLRPALDYLVINELRETLSPGYLARQDANRRRDYGQDPLIAPSDRMALDLF